VIEYPSGLDVEWIAVDREGRVGVFTTAGAGPVPRAYLESGTLLDGIRDFIRSLPEITHYDLFAVCPKPDDFIAFARRGLYSFDWADVHRTTADATQLYEVQARPVIPATVDALTWPASLRRLLDAVTSPDLDFDHAAVDVASAFDCATGVASGTDGPLRHPGTGRPAGRQTGERTMIEFTLAPVDQIEPWGTAGDLRLSWFGLSYGTYWIDLGVARLLEYAQLPGWPRYVDYQIARLHEDLLGILPDVLDPVPEEVAALLARSSAPRVLRALVAQASKEVKQSELADAAYLWARRFIDTSYLTPSAEICLWSTSDTVYVEWDNRDKVDDGRVVWTATRGRQAMDRAAFLDEIAKFHGRFTGAMRARIVEVAAHWSRADVHLDHQHLALEQARREGYLDLCLRARSTPPNWETVIQAIEMAGRDESV
jgi:hypothetical protein